MKKSYKITIVAITFVIVTAVLAFAFVYGNSKKHSEEDNISKSESFEEVEYNGHKYIYNTDIQTIAFLGVDTREKSEEGSTPGWNGQSDTLLVAVLDTKTNKGRLLQISRDSMTDIEIYDMHGEFLAKDNAQLALQYAYGDGGITSCVLVTDRISDILNDIPITYYMSLNMDGIPVIADAVGGIDIVIPEDYTYIDPEYTKGSSVTLTGDNAEQYVRYRDTDETGSNIPRMKRQNQVLQAIIEQLPKKAEKDSNIYMNLFQKADPYMTTNLKIDNIDSLQNFEFDNNIVEVPGVLKEGERHDEFYIDEDELMSIIIDLFYIEK